MYSNLDGSEGSNLHQHRFSSFRASGNEDAWGIHIEFKSLCNLLCQQKQNKKQSTQHTQIGNRQRKY